MGEEFAQAASKLVPLLTLLGVFFGAIIILIIGLRLHQDQQRRKRQQAQQADAGEVITVLGRAFEVEQTAPLPGDEGTGLWYCLLGEQGPARLELSADKTQAHYFPSQAPSPAGEPCPAQVEHDQRSFTRIDPALPLAADWTLCRYQGPDDRHLIIETRAQQITLWNGKSIPAEGVVVLEEK